MHAPLGQAEDDLLVPARNAALVLVDVYPREGPHAEVVKSVIAPVKAAARRAGIPAVYVTNHLGESTVASSQWRQLWLRTLGADVLETWAEPSDELRYLPEIEPADGDIVVEKQHYSGFVETELDSVLKSLGARDLFLVGFDARICVAATATDALSHDYRVFVVREAVATTDAHDGEAAGAAYQHALRYIEACAGYTVGAHDFISACNQTGAG
jgi:nicotinamidase-related amidase